MSAWARDVVKIIKIEFSGFGNLSAKDLLGDQKITMHCPGCDSDFEIAFNEVMLEGDEVRCPHCNNDIRIIHSDETKTTLANLDQSLKELENTLKKFGK